MTDAQPAEKKRSRRIYVYWGVALTLLLTLGLFSWLFVLPVWQVHTVVGTYRAQNGHKRAHRRGWSEAEIERLGGPEAAARKLMFYLRVRRASGLGDWAAVWALGDCGAAGLPCLIELMDDPDERVRIETAEELGDMGGPGATEALLGALDDSSHEVRLTSIRQLQKIGGPREAIAPRIISALCDEVGVVRAVAVEALKVILPDKEIPAPPKGRYVAPISWSDGLRIPLLQRLLKDKDPKVRQAAREALKKIRGAKKEK